MNAILPVERQNRIKELIQDKQNMKISTLSQLLHVSEMTIHRDLKPLLKEGFIKKTFGGILLSKEFVPRVEHPVCTYCQHPINNQLAYRLILNNKQHETTCCAHCGLLRHHQLGDEVSQAICYDFLKQTTISAHVASYVMDTSIDIGCCQPQVLTFENKEHALKFIAGFSGKLLSFTGAKEAVLQRMGVGNSLNHLT